jgi:hypothetical protein
MNTQEIYYIQPPDYPEFFYKSSMTVWRELLKWSWDEYQARLQMNARAGYYRELARQASSFSPERVLAEHPRFRRYCSLMTSELWSKFTRAQKDYIIRCYELAEILQRPSSVPV